MKQLETSTLSNQNIVAALLVHTYTADADRLLIVRLFADQIAGNGDYVAYVTVQRLGAGSAYRVVPITTAAVASGVTSAGLTTIIFPVKNTDVVKVYLTGLAGDTTTPDIITEIWDANPWVTATRTLTQSASSVAAAVQGDDIEVVRGDIWAFSLTGLGDISGRSKIYFTARKGVNEADTASLLQLEEDKVGASTSLLRFNGAAPIGAANGSITIDDEVAGNITIKVLSIETVNAPNARLETSYDVQYIRASDSEPITLTEVDPPSKFTVVPDVTRART